MESKDEANDDLSQLLNSKEFKDFIKYQQTKRKTIYLLLYEIKKFESEYVNFVLKEKLENESESQIKNYLISKAKDSNSKSKSQPKIYLQSIFKIENESFAKINDIVLEIIRKNTIYFRNGNYNLLIANLIEIEKQIVDSFKNSKKIEI